MGTRHCPTCQVSAVLREIILNLMCNGSAPNVFNTFSIVDPLFISVLILVCRKFVDDEFSPRHGRFIGVHFRNDLDWVSTLAEYVSDTALVQQQLHENVAIFAG